MNENLKKPKTILDYCPTNSKIEQYALNVILNLDTVTADDLHVLEAEIANWNRDKRVIGALLKSLEQQGRISKLGYVKSKRPECHGRPILQWQVNHDAEGVA